MKNEKERAKALSVLFGDTKLMQDKISKVQLLENRLRKNIEIISNEQNLLKSRFGDLSSDLQTKELEGHYEKLFTWTGQLELDLPEFSYLTSEKKENFLAELSRLRHLVLNKDYFLIRREFYNAASQTDLLRQFIGFSLYIEKANDILESRLKFDQCNQALNLLKSGELNKFLNSSNLLTVFQLVNYSKKEEFEEELQIILNGQVNNSSSSSLVSEVLRVRGELSKYIQSQNDSADCIYCGHKYEDTDKLLASIQKKEESLKSILSIDGQRIQNLIEKFNLNKVNPLIGAIEKYLESLIIPPDILIKELKAAMPNFGRFTNVKAWLDGKKIKYMDLLFNYEPKSFEVGILSTTTEKLQKRIIESIPQEPDDYSDFEREFNFNNLFSIYFDSQSSNLNKLTTQQIDSKTQFINYKYYESISGDRNKYKENEEKISVLSSKLTSVNCLKKDLTKAVSRYQKSLIKDVEIPFYIYSGKVLQTHQSSSGTGIFIKDKTGDDELKNIRFVADWASDHDVLNTMSSGQIAAIVITLYLALNKVYSRGLGVILIDDPVQTMDEINMISLVELLRNEFSDSQLILSTHEDHVSKYFLYKFLKYNRDVRQIRLIDRKEYQLSNKNKNNVPQE